MMNIENILTSGFKFKEGEDLLRFKFKMMNIMLFITVGILLFFVIMHELGINDLGDKHARSTYLAIILCIAGFFGLRQSKYFYKKVAMFYICVIMLANTSAVLFVPNDEFRLVWFLLTVIVSHLVVGRNFGLFIVALSILIVFSSNQIFNINFSILTLTSFVTSLLMSSLILSAYSEKISSYEIEMLRQNSELKNIVNRDDLTGIMSRHFFIDMADHLFNSSQRNKKPISLLVLDIDFFKNINDNYGHHVGDQMLILFTDTISQYVRKSDIFARLGGDEFAIILFETNKEGALIFAKKILRAIEEAHYDNNGVTIKITASIGVGEKINADIDFEKLIIRTDDALYRAKNNGRNCIAAAD